MWVADGNRGMTCGFFSLAHRLNLHKLCGYRSNHFKKRNRFIVSASSRPANSLSREAMDWMGQRE